MFLNHRIDTALLFEMGEELARRQRLYAAGQIPVYDWAEVKARLEARRNALLK